MRNFKLLTGILVCSAAALVVGCGDDGDTDGTGASGTGATGTGGSTGGTGTGASGGSGGSAGGSGGAGGAGGNTVTYEVTVVDQDAATIEGAGFAIDLADGSRVEGLSDANGIVTLEVPADVDPDQCILHKDGYNFLAVPMALFNGNTELELSIFADLDQTGWLQVTGDGLNMADPGNSSFFVYAQPGTADGDEGITAYDILVPPSTDFTLGAVETSFSVTNQDLTRTFENIWFSQQTGIAAMATIDIDFADPDPASTPFALSVSAPTADTVLSTTGLMFINTNSQNGPAGGSTTCAFDGANDEYDCVGFNYDNGQPVSQTIYVVGEDERNSGGYGRQTVAIADGGPPGGNVDVQFVNVPDITSPAGAGPHPVDTPVEYDVAAGGGNFNVVVSVVNSPTGRAIGTIYADQMGGLQVPELPTGSDPATVWEASMNMELVTCRFAAAGGCNAIGSELWEASPPAN